MALNDILKGMPSMDYGYNEFALPKDLGFADFTQNNRVLDVPPFSHVSLANNHSHPAYSCTFSLSKTSPSCRKPTKTSKSTSITEPQLSASSIRVE